LLHLHGVMVPKSLGFGAIQLLFPPTSMSPKPFRQCVDGCVVMV
jgi:hypothetical protein